MPWWCRKAGNGKKGGLHSDGKATGIPADSRKISMFWDIENFMGGYEFNTARPESIDVAYIMEQIDTVLSEEIHDMESMNVVRKAYADWNKPGMLPLKNQLAAFDFELVSVIEPQENAIGQKITIDLTLSALDSKVEAVVLVANDGRYTRSLQTCLKQNKLVVRGKIKGHTNVRLPVEGMCNDFVSVYKIDSVESERDSSPPLRTAPTNETADSLQSLPRRPAVTGSTDSNDEQEMPAAPTESFEEGEAQEDHMGAAH
jgi:NYN domain